MIYVNNVWSITNDAGNVNFNAGCIVPMGSLTTSAQLRAARAILMIDQAELSRLSGVSKPTIQRLETQNPTGLLGGRQQTILALQRALEGRGVKFTERGVEVVPTKE